MESGERFKKLKEKLSKEKGVKNPAALASSIARKKYGEVKLEKMSLAGKKNK